MDAMAQSNFEKGIDFIWQLQFSVDGNGAGTEGGFEPETMEEYCRLAGSPAYGWHYVYGAFELSDIN